MEGCEGTGPSSSLPNCPPFPWIVWYVFPCFRGTKERKVTAREASHNRHNPLAGERITPVQHAHISCQTCVWWPFGVRYSQGSIDKSWYRGLPGHGAAKNRSTSTCQVDFFVDISRSNEPNSPSQVTWTCRGGRDAAQPSIYAAWCQVLMCKLSMSMDQTQHRKI